MTTHPIDIDRLRRLVTDADAAFAASRALQQRITAARENLRSSERYANDTKFTPGGAFARTLEAARQGVVEAQEVLDALLAAQEDLQERSGLVRTLASRGVDYANSLGVLPADLRRD